MKDEFFLAVVTVVLTFVTLSFMAQVDPRNPMPEIGLPVDPDDFNLYALASQAPQLDLLAPATLPTAGDKYCWISFFCPDLPWSDEIALAIHNVGISVANFFIFIGNAMSQGVTVAVLFFTAFLTIWNFSAYPVFQANLLFQMWGLAMTAILGGTVALWLFQKVPLPFVFRGG